MNEINRPKDFARSNHKQRLAALHEKTDRLHLFEFWGEDSSDEHAATEKLRADRTPAVPHLWKYRDIEPCLLEAAELIPMEMSERRSIIMVNPALRPYVATTTTLFAAYRINTPHEMMPPHRHSPNAIRFGLTGATKKMESEKTASRLLVMAMHTVATLMLTITGSMGTRACT